MVVYESQRILFAPSEGRLGPFFSTVIPSGFQKLDLTTRPFVSSRAYYIYFEEWGQYRSRKSNGDSVVMVPVSKSHQVNRH